MRHHHLSLVALLLSSAIIRGAGPHEEHISRLVSQVPSEREAGLKWLAEQGPQVIAGLIEQVERGDPKQQAEALETLSLLISPWRRGVERGVRHHGQIELFYPERPT